MQHVPHSGLAVNTAAKSVSEDAPTFSLMDRSSGSAVWARSSLFRRLLDPILKPSTEKLVKNSVSTNKVCRPSQGLSDSSMLRPLKAKLGLIGCRAVDVWDSKPDKGAAQALLRVAVNNGSDVLAATVKKLGSSRKEQSRWIYTLFGVPSIKRKKVKRIRGGCKVEDQHYIPGIIAQVDVSECQSSMLSAVEQLKHGDSGTPHLQTNDELAAIVVSEVPLRDSRNSIVDGCWHRDLKIKTTVILPSGVHNLPRKGEPSSLIERWKSGGSCDCGGWDLGCKLRILFSQNHKSNAFFFPR